MFIYIFIDLYIYLFICVFIYLFLYSLSQARVNIIKTVTSLQRVSADIQHSEISS